MQVQLLRDIEELIPVLRRYARLLVRDPHNADDLVQDCLEWAVFHLDQVRAETNLRAWLLGVMATRLSDGQREKGRAEVGLEGSCESSWSPRRQEHDRLIEDLREAFLRLPASQKLAMICVIFEGLPYDEAAKLLDISVGTAKTRVARGREALRRTIAADPLLRTA
jgi:RNA polymerase sigma-70 factor (ECF subfamily)